MAEVDQGSTIPVTASTLVVQFLHAGVQLVGQLYEIHSLRNGERPVDGWDACSLHAKLTTLDDSITGGFLREIGPLSEQDQVLNGLCSTCHLILQTVLSRLRLIRDFGLDSLVRVGELKAFWPREDVEALEERIMSLKLELEVATSSAHRYVPYPFLLTR